jgi:hypothetical protein
MKIGDRIEVVAVPGLLPSGMGTQALFEACVGRIFSVDGIDENGLLELHVGEVVGEESYMQSIWIEADCVRLCEAAYAPRVILHLPLSNEDLLDAFVEKCIRDKVSLISVVGEGAARIEEIIDELVVGDGSDCTRFIATS